MKQLGLISITASLMASLVFCACSDDSVPNASVVPAPSDVSSSSLVNSSSDVAYSEADNPVSSSSLAVSSSSIDMSSSSSDESLSSSAVADSPTFSKYLAQFVSPGENSLNFDSHVVAFNANGFTSKCEDAVVQLDDEENIILLNSISEENIAECFPKTASLLKNKFSPDVKFYAIVIELGADPLFAVLNKFTADEIVFYGVHPGGENCVLSASMTRTIFLVADSDEFVKNGNIPVSGQKFHSDIWKCDESGRNIPSVRNFGEWYSDSLL